MAEPRRLPAAAGGVLLQAGRVLLLHNRLNGEWRLPKGRIDRGETPLQAALREVTEETGFTQLEAGADLGTRSIEYHLDNGLVRRELTYYVMTLRGYSRRARTRRDAQRFGLSWLGVDEALERLTFEVERLVLRAALAADDAD